MNNLEQRIRELPRYGPSEVLDARIAAVLKSPPGTDAVRRRRRPSPLQALAATAIAAGAAGFAAGLGTGHWLTAPSPGPDLAERTVEPRGAADANPAATLVRLTDARVGAGLDFSQSLEPFQVQPVEQEGS